MSEWDLKRIKLLTEIRAGTRTVESGAAVMGLAWRQTFRLLARYKELDGFGDPPGTRPSLQPADEHCRAEVHG